MKIIYQDKYIEIRKSDIDHCIEYIRKKITTDANIDKEMLNGCLNKLSAKYREPVVLRYFQLILKEIFLLTNPAVDEGS